MKSNTTTQIIPSNHLLQESQAQINWSIDVLVFCAQIPEDAYMQMPQRHMLQMKLLMFIVITKALFI